MTLTLKKIGSTIVQTIRTLTLSSQIEKIVYQHFALKAIDSQELARKASYIFSLFLPMQIVNVFGGLFLMKHNIHIAYCFGTALTVIGGIMVYQILTCLLSESTIEDNLSAPDTLTFSSHTETAEFLDAHFSEQLKEINSEDDRF